MTGTTIIPGATMLFLAVVENPLHELFFGVYAVMILTFLAYLIVSVLTARK